MSKRTSPTTKSLSEALQADSALLVRRVGLMKKPLR
jgi:hypothetical protein